MGVGARLRAARRAAGLSQAALAGRVGIDRVSVSRYESGAVMPAADVYLRLLSACRACRGGPMPALDAEDLALLQAQLARPLEARVHASEELSRLRAAATSRG